MFYRVVKGTATFEALSQIKARMEECDQQAQNLVNKLGGLSSISRADFIGGGIDGIEFKEKPEGWMKVHPAYHRNMFYPKEKGNRVLLLQLKELPTVRIQELNAVVGYQSQTINLTHYRGIGASWGQDYHLIRIATDAVYTPLPDMEEILASEYKLLKDVLELDAEAA